MSPVLEPRERVSSVNVRGATSADRPLLQLCFFAIALSFFFCVSRIPVVDRVYAQQG